ncbi:DoxX family membrane protein [Georgenia sp. MJ170]|uniref:DoxX family membrane protein n=1 Tax=Georgenia sunbinii TaxID=3117728 RepID=UPI002F2685DD
MSLSRRLARPLLASSFLASGLDALLRPDAHVVKFREVESLLEKAGVPPAVTGDTKLLVRVSGAVTLVAAGMLATNRNPRSAALALAALTVPITIANNPVWTTRDKSERKRMRDGLLQGASLVGGLALAGLDRDGKPSLVWRAANTREHKALIREIKAAAKETKADLKSSLKG